MNKPAWWPKRPYPEDIFPMKRERYAEIVPDPQVRTALSGMLGREFWHIASEMIWQRFREAKGEIRMYVYIRSDPGWTVGFYSPDGKWHAESYHDSKEAAAERVHWLNGGEARRL